MEHLRAHLAMRLERDADERVHGVLPLSPRCYNTDGSLSIGAVATMVDVAVVSGTHDAHRDRFDGGVVTSQLALRMFGSPTGSSLRAEGVAVRVGRGGIVGRSYVRDDDGTVIGLVVASSTALAGGGSSHRRNPDRVNDMFAVRATPTDGPSMDEYMALEPAGADGVRRLYRLPFHERLRNVNSVLHGGGACLIIEQAARCAAMDLGLTPFRIDELDVHFLMPGLVGPFTATVETMPDEGDRRILVVEVLDDGRESRRIAFGMAGATRSSS
jgi:acyl-coenzyme A thioesterase PaaI-like protein